ncbi:MAG: signal recognition particle protein [Armatimonadetes bacterium]|jgi:signal recognition particle subunit SRP54|nr:signal recognition particle protein [Armatimonadota bacterium]MDI9602193.1 signal recognition particle protein [Acidobacteriota bacterium]NLN89722.1 signal recognition particle protein [candidate division WS1 bacterium]
MFETLSDKLQGVFRRFRGRARLTERDLDEGLREVRLALLDADAHFSVVREFNNKVKERALGAEVSEALDPAQQVIKIVFDELVALLGADESKITYADTPPTVIVLCGLQGGGKTTTAGKLAVLVQKQKHRPLLVATDIHRPAAIRQLEVVGEQIGVPVFKLGDQAHPADIARAAVRHATQNGLDVVIVDTAGRTHTDAAMMDEIRAVVAAVDPHETLLVLDALTGQDAVNVAESFAAEVSFDGVIMTKMDGDARGGAALSVRAVSGVPIRFIGMGEKLDALDPFHPDRIARRILGMGDVLSLIEKSQETFDQDQAARMQEKLMNEGLDLEDFLQQIQQMRRVGPLGQILEMLPKGLLDAFGGAGMPADAMDPREIDRVEAIVYSMTPDERRDPDKLNTSRKRRIARGSGTSMADVNSLLKQFSQTQMMMKQMVGGRGPAGRGAGLVPGMPGRQRKATKPKRKKKRSR